MKQPPSVLKHQLKLAKSLAQIVKDKSAKHPVREALSTTSTTSTHTSHKLAIAKSQKKRYG